MDTHSTKYKRAFEAYLRKGIPIELSLKQARPATHYIWRTRKDSKVRPSHAANDGKIFAWDDPPPTGHPGEDFGCRCTAVAYSPQIDERMEMTMSGIADAGSAWSTLDFLNHYKNGGGSAVRLRDTGHLQYVVDEYWRQVEIRLFGQIADAARETAGTSFSYDFRKPYKMEFIVYSLGDTTIGGVATGSSQIEKTGALKLSGHCQFYLRDAFTDPVELGIEFPDISHMIYMMTGRDDLAVS